MDRLEIGSNAVAGAGVEVDIWEGDAEGNELTTLSPLLILCGIIIIVHNIVHSIRWWACGERVDCGGVCTSQ